MKLSDFTTLAEAQAYQKTVYKPITSNKAAQFFALTGMANLLEAGLSNNTQIEVISGITTTIGNLCKTILDTSSKSGEVFAVDPSTSDGQLNIIGSAKLVENGIYGAQLEAAFFALGKSTLNPFETRTKHDFELAKGIINRKAVTQVDGILTITTNVDCERHNPQVYQYIESSDYYKRVAGFRDVESAGIYKIEVPKLTNLLVDDAYSVIQGQ